MIILRSCPGLERGQCLLPGHAMSEDWVGQQYQVTTNRLGLHNITFLGPVRGRYLLIRIVFWTDSFSDFYRVLGRDNEIKIAYVFLG